jgi:hypothetical protein
MGMGILARNCMGVVKAAMCVVIPYIRDPTVAEAIGAQRAVEFGHEMGFNSIELEGDAREIILTLGNSVESTSRYETIISETRQILGSLCSWRISHVRREGNMHGCSSVGYVCFLSTVPLYLD